MQPKEKKRLLLKKRQLQQRKKNKNMNNIKIIEFDINYNIDALQ